MEKITVSMSIEELKGFLKVASIETIEELVGVYADKFLNAKDPVLSGYLLRAKNVDKAAHMRIVVDNAVGSSDKKIDFIDIVRLNENVIKVEDWLDLVKNSGRANIIAEYGKAFGIELNKLRDAFLELEPNWFSASEAVDFAYECFPKYSDRCLFEDFVKRSKQGGPCMEFAELIKEYFDIDELLQIAADDGKYSLIAKDACHRFWDDRLNVEFLQKLQYHILRGKDAAACYEFMYQARGGSCRQENLTLKDGFDIELLLNEIALYSTDRETRRKTLKELQGMGLKLMTKEEYDKCTSNYDAYMCELQEAEQRETEREIRRRKAEERQLRHVRKIQPQSDDDFELPFN